MYVSLIFSVWMRCREGRIHSGDPRGPRALVLGAGRAGLSPALSPGMLPCAAKLPSDASVAAGVSPPRPAAAPRKEPQALHLPPATRLPLRALGQPAPSPGCPLLAGSGEESAEPSARRCRSCNRSRYRTSASRADSSSKRTRDGEGPRGRRGRPQLESPLDESLRLPPSRGATLGLPLGSLTRDRQTDVDELQGLPGSLGKAGQEGENPVQKMEKEKSPPTLYSPAPFPALCPGCLKLKSREAAAMPRSHSPPSPFPCTEVCG